MKKLLVTGCNGQLGRAINKIYHGDEDYSIINTDVEDLDITDVDEVCTFIGNTKPYAIINCAAHTGVDACETEIDKAYKINAVGPRNLAIASKKTGCKLVQVSTDYVFEGNADRPYTEFDTPNPQGIYGKTKLEGENFVKEFADRYFIIRTAWLYGDGKNFVRTMLRLAESNDIVKVVGDQVGSPTSAMELASMIKFLIPTENYGLFHGTCEGVCSWAEFAEEIFRLAGKKTRVKHITSDEYSAKAKRPAYSVLENYLLKLTTDYQFASWQSAIKKFMDGEVS